MTNVLRASVGLAILLLSTPLAACSGKNGDAIATVNGQPISRADYNERLKSQPNPRLALMGLVTDVLLDQYAQVHKITIPDDEIVAREDAIKLMSPSLPWAVVVGKPQPSQDDIRAFVRHQLIIDRGVSYGIHVTSAQVKQYYDQHRSSFDKPGHEMSFAQATPEITSMLRLAAAAPMAAGFIGNLIQGAKIVVNDPTIPPLVPPATK